MRDKNRIKSFLQKLEELWLQYPDYRFGQLFNLLHKNINGDPFYAEENKWELVINRLICKKFGNLESDVGCCVDCSIERNNLFRRCWEYSRDKNVKEKRK